MQRTLSLNGIQPILTFPFKGPRWQTKLAIAVLVSLAGFIIPILPGLVVLGYTMAPMRAVIDGEENPQLPEWVDWSSFLARGFKVWAAMLIYLLPSFVILIGGYIALMGSSFLSLLSQSSNNNPATIDKALAVQLIGSLGGTAIIAIGFLLSLLTWVFLPVIISHVVATDSFAAAFKFGEWWRILRANLAGFFTALALVLGIYAATLFVLEIFYFTVILCIIVPVLLFLIGTYISLVAAVAFGEAYRRGIETLNEQTAQEALQITPSGPQ